MEYQNALLVAGANILTLALSAIGWVSVVTGQACFAVKTGGEVTALLAHAAIHTCAVTITLACWKIKVGCLGKTREFDFFYNSYFCSTDVRGDS